MIKNPSPASDNSQSIQSDTKLTEERLEKKLTQERMKRTVFKDSGVLPQGCFESIYVDDKPFFLVYSDGKFRTEEKLEVGDKIFVPKELKQTPYEPYGFSIELVPSNEELFKRTFQVISAYIDVELSWKQVLTACIGLSHHQEKLQTVPYILVYGDNESGKSTVLQILKQLCYRPMYGVTIPAADLYGYLEDSDGIGCIFEDEIQGINKDTDKIKIYKAGYKKGATVPRTIITQNSRIIKYFNTFSFKACASEQLPQVKGFNERFISVPMVEGFPEKEWADVTDEELGKMSDLRNLYLKWRMVNRRSELPMLSMPMKGRFKELWKPILQMVHGLSVFESIANLAEEQRKERLEERQRTLEGQIVKAVYDICCATQKKPIAIPFSVIWERLRKNLDGVEDAEKSYIMHTSEFFDLSKQKIGHKLREVLSGKSRTVRENDEKVVKVFDFDFDKLVRIAKKYNLDVTKLPRFPNS